MINLTKSRPLYRNGIYSYTTIRPINLNVKIMYSIIDFISKDFNLKSD